MLETDRRRLLQTLPAAGAVLAAAPLIAHGTDQAASGLGDLAAARGLRFGSAVRNTQLADEDYVALVRRDCSVVVAENAQKMYAILPTRDAWRFDEADALARFAEANALGLRGHALLWNHPDYLPDWLTDTAFDGPRDTESFLRGYIGRVAGRYAPQIYAWDVVNETLDPETGALRPTPFTKAMGPQVVDVAFEEAKAAAPGATLSYNDYMSWEDGHESHRAAVLRLLERMVSDGVPVDGLGIQGHAKWTDRTAEFSSARQKAWRGFLDEVTGMGLELYVTELDVNDGDATGTDTQRDAEIAAYTKDYLDLMLDYPQTKEVLTWGLVDHDSWIQAFVDEGELVRRPLPFDDAYRPKPMYEAIAKAFRAAPERS
ncbi:endo-1,4-beta-xylanase [Parvularcula dongshanensis]|uniref:Beta-xylanase n=1 Tax=Parvularcula dongshanensis TaxID=1173995 RepID=A0A840I5M7_9PROT|nr:endo-1,4-beta-xylanase [Parvularcula dongshanensis]MBB4659581.1 endo-1,4-beta-xylanase [Parvularcula dongshanensis]